MTDQSYNPAIDQFLDAIAKQGVMPPDSIIADGKLHRFSSSGKTHDDAGWYVFRDGAIPTGSFGDFRSNKTGNWIADIGRPLTNEETKDFRNQQREAQRARTAELLESRAKAKDKANGILRISEPAPDDHPYLLKKGIKAHGLRQWKDMLVIPMVDETGGIQSLQLIAGDGGKKFLKGGKMQGCFYVLGELVSAENIMIAEGFATAATIHEATGFPTIVAFNAGNLLSVAKTIRAQHPNAIITICADDDFKTKDNPGLTKAQEAADAVNGTVLIPEFGADRPDKATDFNDMAAHSGKEAVNGFFTRHFSETESDLSQKISPEGLAHEDEACFINAEEPKPETDALPKPKRQFTPDEVATINQIWKPLPHQVTYHSETSYQIVIDDKSKVLVTKDKIEFPKKAKHRSDIIYGAACEHALKLWNGKMEVHGSHQHKIKAWAFASIHGVEITNFKPSASELAEANRIIALSGKFYQPIRRHSSSSPEPRLNA